MADDGTMAPIGEAVMVGLVNELSYLDRRECVKCETLGSFDEPLKVILTEASLISTWNVKICLLASI